MINLQHYLEIGVFTTAFTILGLGLLVYCYNPKNKLNRVFGLMSLMYFGWSFFLALTWVFADVRYNRLCNIFSLIGNGLYVHLMVLLAEEEKERKNVLKVIYFLMVASLILFLSFPSLFIRAVVVKLGIIIFPNAGPLFYLQFFLFLIFSIYGFSIIYRVYLNSQGIKKQQFGYVLLASSIGFLSGASTYPLCFDIPVLPTIVPFVALYPIIIAYAILRHRLLNIEIIIRRSFIYSALVISITVLYASIIFLVQQILQERQVFNLWFSALLAGIIITTSFRKLEDIFSRITDRVFFKGKYDYQKTLQKFNQGISSYLEIDDLINSVSEILVKDFKIKSVSFFLLDDSKNQFMSLARNLSGNDFIVEKSPLINLLSQAQRPLVLEELERGLSLKNSIMKDFSLVQQSIAQMHDLNIAVSIPIISKAKIIALLNLGPKLSGDMYSSTDLELLMALANQSAIAIENINLIRQEKETAKKVSEAQAKAKYIKILEQSSENLQRINKKLTATQTQLVKAARFAAVGQLASGVAHEINNPLTGIVGNVQLLKLRLRKYPEFTLDDCRVIFASIEESAQRCNIIVHGLVEFSKGEKKKKQIIDFNELIKSVYSLVGHLSEVSGVKINLYFKSQPVLVYVHPSQMQQVLFNMISNSQWAIKKKKTSGIINIQTDIQSENNQPFAKITFQDDGIGIASRNQSRIFEPFFTTKEVGKGVGLGLSIVYGIIREHGGTIEVKSEYDKGTTFIIKLPLYEE